MKLSGQIYETPDSKKKLAQQLLSEMDTDFQSPQTNFQRIMAIQKDTPAKQFKNLLQLMRENLGFEKHIIGKTHGIEIPKEIQIQNKRRQTFQNYQQVLKYSNFVRQKQHFYNRKFMSENSSSSNSKLKNDVGHVVKDMAEIVEAKKNKLLTDQSLIKIQQDKVIAILNNNKARQKLFQEALLIQRLQQIQHRKKVTNQSLNLSRSAISTKTIDGRRRYSRTRMATQQPEIPQKLKNIHPKHIRLMEQFKNQQQYFKNKFVCNQRKLRFYNYAHKIQKNSLKNQKQQNKGVIETILKFNDELGRKSQRTNALNARKMERVFLKYSNSDTENPQNMYKQMTIDNLKKLMDDFGLQWKSINQLLAYLQPFKKITNFQFLEVLYILSRNNCNEYDKPLKMDQFLQKYIYSKKEICCPENWLQLDSIKSKYEKFLKISKFFDNIQKTCMLIKKQKYHASKFLDFNDLLQFLWAHKLFPDKVSKKTARFAFLYGRSQAAGLSFDDLINVLLYLGFSCAPQQSKDSQIKWIADRLCKRNLN